MDKQYEHLLVLTTCSSEEEAVQIATTLTSEKAAACCNVVPGIRSLYFWQGKPEDDKEVLLLIKTTTSSFARVWDIIIRQHSYDLPEIIAIPIVDGSTDYLQWVSEQTTR